MVNLRPLSVHRRGRLQADGFGTGSEEASWLLLRGPENNVTGGSGSATDPHPFIVSDFNQNLNLNCEGLSFIPFVAD